MNEPRGYKADTGSNHLDARLIHAAPIHSITLFFFSGSLVLSPGLSAKIRFAGFSSLLSSS